MSEVRIDLRDLPADVGIVFLDRTSTSPRRFYNDSEMEKVWSCIQERIEGKKDVDLLVVGFMPGVMPGRLTYHCLMADVVSFSICRPGNLVELVYDIRQNIPCMPAPWFGVKA